MIRVNRKRFNFTFKLCIIVLAFFISAALVKLLNFENVKVDLITIEEKLKNNHSQPEFRLIISKNNQTNPLDWNFVDFEGFDNHAGFESNIIPNIVHLIFYKTKQISFYQAINIYSIYLNHNPDFIYFHCDGDCAFNGYYWNQINSILGLKKKIQLHSFQLKDTIFSQEFRLDPQRFLYFHLQLHKL